MSRSAEFYNPKSTLVRLPGPNGKIITVNSKTKIILPEFFMKYSPRKVRFIRFLNNSIAVKRTVVQSKKTTPKYKKTNGSPRLVTESINKKLRKIHGVKGSNRQKKEYRRGHRIGRPNTWKSRTVGKADLHSQGKYFEAASVSKVPISNNIGIGILSFNRFGSLQRLLTSIMRYTDVKHTTVFISDESSNFTSEQVNWLQSHDNIITMFNQRIGIAGNTNRLMRCLDRFKYKFILNDDVEILADGWEDFYINAMSKSGIHHFCFRQPGIYGANKDQEVTRAYSGIQTKTITEKPHGGVLVFDQKAFEAVGYFDENFGQYGMEHVDWSNRVAKYFKVPGFHDPVGSENYFTIHNEVSAVPNRISELQKGRAYYEKIKDSRIKIKASDKSNVPSMSIIIPYRNTGRSNSMRTVINNIKAQRFPRLEIILVEQDSRAHVNPLTILPIKYIHIPSAINSGFNKSEAFNKGVIAASNELLILHDADILAPGEYFRHIYEALQTHTGCHLGDHVYYLAENSTATINNNAILSPNYNCVRLVKYFEGGSLGLHRHTYFQIGGFNESFVGYGVEDCCFYKRLTDLSKFANDRKHKFFHLYHNRTDGWDDHHNYNRKYYGRMLKKYPSSAHYAEMLKQNLIKKYPQVSSLI